MLALFLYIETLMSFTFTDYKSLAREYNLIPVTRRLLADMETPVSVLSRFAEHENAFLFESVEGGETWGRYSFVGVDPELFLTAEHNVPGRDNFSAPLRSLYAQTRPAILADLPRFFGGAVGFLAYEAVGAFENLPGPKQTNTRREVCSKFLLADNLIVFDNLRHTMTLVACSRPQMEDLEKSYQEAVSRLDRMEELLSHQPPSATAAEFPAPLLNANMTKAEFQEIVAAARKHIIAGDVIQAVLSQKWQAKTVIPPLQLYRALRLLNPSPYMYFLKIGTQVLVGSSPEIMVRLTGSRVELRPIAGTRRRGTSTKEDEALVDELLSDEKEKAEHVMLVDLGRNDLGRISETGSVQVRDFMTVERYSHVMHIVSHVEGILRRDKDALDVLRSVFPAGTLSGAPKVRAMELINYLEPEPRGAYGGALGYIGYDGSMDFAITIRTMDLADGNLSIQTGAGIVYDSDPQKEWEETNQKARALFKAVELAAGGLKPDVSPGLKS